MDLSSYYQTICKEPMLSREEEFELFQIIKNPNSSPQEVTKARDRIIKANLRFAFSQAKKFSKNDPSSFEDLIGAANEGLLVGLEKYNPSHEVRFLSYAGWWVKQRILSQMAKMRIVALPIWKQQLSARIERLRENNEKLKFDELVTEFPEVAEKDLRELFDTRYLTYYISDMEEDNFQIDPIGAEIERGMDNRLVAEAVSSLPSPHREIITMTFGMDDGEEVKPATIMKNLGLDRDQFKECKKEAMKLLSERFKKHNDPL
jgi:RNA polymerase primary sigma factor